MSSLLSRDELRPVITGLGVVSAIGANVEEFWQAVLAGTQGAKAVRSFDVSKLRNSIGCEVDEASLDGVDPSLPRASRLGAQAAREALSNAAIDSAEIDALCAGTTMGDLPSVEDHLSDVTQPQNAAAVQGLIDGDFAGRIAAGAGLACPSVTIATSCSAGNLSIFRAAEMVRTGRASAVLAGGSDAFSRLAFIGFSRMRAMATEKCSPFGYQRQGMLLGEGAAFVVVESAAAAAERGAEVLAEVGGYGLSCDAYHIATPSPDGRGAAAAMRLALEDADVAPEEVDYVSAHGTGTHQNDLAEGCAYREVLGERRPYISSLKALVGHCLGAASAVEAVASVLSLRDQRVIPAWNVEQPDEKCDVELPLPDRIPETTPLRVVVSNGFAFGGNNSCLVLRAA